jgi:hypothetical protein
MNRSFFPGAANIGRVEEPQVREPLPLVARHLPEERRLPVHDLVVTQRQHEAFRTTRTSAGT